MPRACRANYVHTKLGVDSSSRFPVGVRRTDRQRQIHSVTDTTDYLTLHASATVDVSTEIHFKHPLSWYTRV